MKMKQLAILIAVISIFGLAGCAPETAESPESVGSSESSKVSSVASDESSTAGLSEREHLESQLVETPDVQSTDWNLLLVNQSNLLTEDLAFEQYQAVGGEVIDARLADDYEHMIADGEAQGLIFIFESGYRSFDYQEAIYNSVYNTNLGNGYTPEEAQQMTEDYIAIPGTSEHMTGLALDITEPSVYHDSNGLITEFEETPEGKWLHTHAPDYGFVLRYPRGKDDYIDVNYESWHFRYVGIENAQYMQANNLVLEEYVEILKHNEAIRQAIEALEE